MNEKQFQKILKKDKYQVFLMKTKVYFPFFFAIHCFFITNKKGIIDRFDAGKFYFPSKKKIEVGIFKNIDRSTSLKIKLQGLNMFYKKQKPRFKSHLISYIEEITAKNMIKVIEDSIIKYPYKDTYKIYPGPNSNTYIQWILKQFPESNFKLPVNAIGKNFKK